MWKYALYVVIAVFVSSLLFYSTPKKDKKETYVNDPSSASVNDTKLNEMVKDLAYNVSESQKLIERIQNHLAQKNQKKETYQDSLAGAPLAEESSPSGSVAPIQEAAIETKGKGTHAAPATEEDEDSEDEDEGEGDAKGKKREGFANFTGVQSRQFDNFMLL